MKRLAALLRHNALLLNTRARPAQGNLQIQVGDMSGALGNLARALALLGRTRDATLKSRVLNELAVLHKTLGDFQKALKYYRQSLALSEASGTRQDVARAYTNVGSVYFSLGTLRKASECLRKALAVSREIGDDMGVMRALVSLSVLNSDLGDERAMLDAMVEASTRIRAGGLPANTLSKAARVVLVRLSVSSPPSESMQIWLDVLCRSMPTKSMAGLLLKRVITPVFKEQGIMPQQRGQPLRPIQSLRQALNHTVKLKPIRYDLITST